jgi:hypothetical protein
MAVSTDNAFSGPYLTNGVTTVFPFTFTAPSEDEVGVILRDAAGVDAAASGYTVSLVDGGGGSVVFAVAPAAGYSLLPLLEPAFTQNIAFENGSAWRAEPVNEGYDRSAARDQALKRDVDRGIKTPVGENGVTLPTAEYRAEKALFFEADGTASTISIDDFAEPANEAASRSEAYAGVLSSINTGYWDDAINPPPPDAAEGQTYFVATEDGREILARNVGGVGEVVFERLTRASMSTSIGAGVGFSTEEIYPRETVGDRLKRTVYLTDAPFLADASGTTDISAAFAAAWNHLISLGGGDLVVPSGDFAWTQAITLSHSTDVGFNTPRVSIRGAGSRGSVLKLAAGNYVPLTIIGSNTPGAADAQIVIEGLCFDKPDALGSCISINRYSHLAVRDVKCNGSDLAIGCTDVQESIFENVICAFANYGLRMQPGSFTSPNNITLLHCKMGNCHFGGAEFINAAQVNIIGGSYEGNNNDLIGGTAPTYGIRLIWNDASKIEGTVGLNVIGAYLEVNGLDVTSPTPTGDIWIVNSVAPMSATIQGCSFQRHDEFFCTNNIRMETSGGFKHTLNLIGNGHQGFHGYSPNAGRPYVFLSSPAEVYVSEVGCRYVADAERPDWTARNNDTHDFALQAMARFNGAGATGVKAAQQAMNIASISKTATGVYAIAYARAMAGPYNSYVVQVIGSTGVGTITAENENGFTVETYAMDGTTHADFQVSVEVKGRPLA